MVNISYSLMFSALSHICLMNDMKTHAERDTKNTPSMFKHFQQQTNIYKGENNSFQQRNDNGLKTVRKTYRSRNEKRKRKFYGLDKLG